MAFGRPLYYIIYPILYKVLTTGLIEIMRIHYHPVAAIISCFFLSALSWEGVASAGLVLANSKHEEESTDSNRKHKHDAMMPLVRRGLQESGSVATRTFPSILNFLTFPVCESVGGVPTNDRVLFFAWIFYLIFRRDRLGACPASTPPSSTPSVGPSSMLSSMPSAGPSASSESGPTWRFGLQGLSCDATCGNLGCTDSVVAGGLSTPEEFEFVFTTQLGENLDTCSMGVCSQNINSAPFTSDTGFCKFPANPASTSCGGSGSDVLRICCCGDSDTSDCPLS